MGYEYLLGKVFCFRKLLDFMTLRPLGNIITVKDIFYQELFHINGSFSIHNSQGLGTERGKSDPFGLNT